MALLQTNCLRLKPSTRLRGMYEASFPFKPEGFRLALKMYPGVTYGPQIGIRQDGLWFVPMEMYLEVGLLAREWGLVVNLSGPADPALPAPKGMNQQLHDYQQKAVVQSLHDRRFMLNFEMGCIDGDALVHVNYGGNGRSIPLRELHRRWLESWSQRPTGYARIRSLCGEELHLNAITGVRYTGIQNVLEVVTKSGKTIKLTPDHEVLTPDGWVEAQTLTRGRAVMTNGQWTDKDGYIRVGGLKNKHTRWTTGGVYEHILVAEKKLGRKLRKHERVHHKNGIKHDNRPENLEVLTQEEHMRHHGRNGGYHNLKRGYFVPKYETVVSVKPAGTCEVYDVSCAAPHHNFVANGIVVHNCGKTPTAIETMRLAGVQSALIICPALVRQNWADEIEKWWSGHPVVEIIDSGSQCLSYFQCYPKDSDIVITSYELLKKLAFSKEPVKKYDNTSEGYIEYETEENVLREAVKNRFQAIIIDESHYIANNRAGRAADVRAVVDANPNALLLMLTATPVTNEPKGLWYQLDTLYPHRFGTWPGFMKRYANVSSNEYTDWVVKGLNEEHAAELSQRLAAISSRVTKHEVAHLLPPFSVQTIRVPPKDRGFDPRELLEKFTRMDQHRNNGDELIRAAGEQKVDSACEQVLDALGGGATHVCVLTHLKATAAEIAAELGATKKMPPVVLIDGNVPIAKRMEELKKARGLPRCILVATMHSVNVGIDLTAFTVCVFAELDYTPANVIQALGRFSRLSGKLPSTCILLVLSGTQDEIVASRVLNKVKDINAVIRAGQSESEVAKALEPKMDDETFFTELREAAMHMAAEDEYVG